MTCLLICVYYKSVKLQTSLLVKNLLLTDPSLLCLVLGKAYIRSRVKLSISMSTPVALRS